MEQILIDVELKDRDTMRDELADDRRVKGIYSTKYCVFVIWSVIDVQEIRSDLTDEQALDVLRAAQNKWGITLTSIKFWAGGVVSFCS